MRRAALLVLPVLALLGLGALLWVRRQPEEAARAPEAATTVSGTVTGRHGTVWNVRIEARDGERLLAGTWTNYLGFYSLDVPPGVPFELHALPIDLTRLVADHRPMTLRRGEERTESFDLTTVPLTEGMVVSPVSVRVCLEAVREDAPGPPSIKASWPAGSRFVFWALETGAPYHIECASPGWRLEGPVCFRGGDTGIVVPLVRLLRLNMWVREVVTGEPIAAFAVKVLRPDGKVFAVLPGTDGRLIWETPHPDPTAPLDQAWSLVVSADGFWEEETTWDQFVFLQQVRSPSLTLRVRLEDGAAYSGDLRAYGVARYGLGGVDARAKEATPGRYEAVLPPGRWWIRVGAEPDLEARPCDVTISDGLSTVVDVPPLERQKRVAR